MVRYRMEQKQAGKMKKKEKKRRKKTRRWDKQEDAGVFLGHEGMRWCCDSRTSWDGTSDTSDEHARRRGEGVTTLWYGTVLSGAQTAVT